MRHNDTNAPLVAPQDVLPLASARYPQKVALITATRSLTYSDLDEMSTRLASSLRARGVAPGDRVSLLASNRWEWIVAYHGALKASAVVNPINAMLTPSEVQFVLRDCGSSALFTSGDKLDALTPMLDAVESLGVVVAFEGGTHRSVPFAQLLGGSAARRSPEVDPAAPSTIGYTSGTTGYPKGAVQSHRAVLLNWQATARMHGRSEADVVVTALPAPHVYGNVAINSTFLAGGTVVLMERFVPAGALALIDEHRATMFEGVPAMYSMMLSDRALDSSGLRSLSRCTVGGQTIAPATVEAWESKTGAPLIELWGMTELAGLGTTNWHDRPPVRGSIGVALPGLELRVASFGDPDRDAPIGEPGELMARGPHVMLGYFGNEETTKEVIGPDGWMHTGDVALVDQNGHYFIVDRLKDMILTAGYNIYPAEIERVLAAHPDVALVGVGAVADEVKGELARAYVVLKAGSSPTEDEIIDFARQHLAPYKVPRSVRFVDALPLTSSGKMMRRRLAEFDA